MKQFNTCLMLSILMAAFFTSPASAVAGVVAIVNKANTSADRATIGKLYSLEAKSWSDGAPAKLYELSGESERDEFFQAYAGKSAGIIKSIWARAVFSGRGVPPKMLNSDTEMKSEIIKDKNAVGFVDESSVDASVRAVR